MLMLTVMLTFITIRSNVQGGYTKFDVTETDKDDVNLGLLNSVTSLARGCHGWKSYIYQWFHTILW